MKLNPFFVFGLLALCAPTAFAQNPQPVPTISESQPLSMNPSEIFSRIHATNQMEINLGELAQKKGTTTKIRRYGDRLARDHKFADRQIMALAKQERIAIHEPIALNDQDQMKMNEHKMLTDQLESSQGADFERAFLEGMQKGHEEVIAMLKSVKVEQVPSQQLIGKLIPILEQHLTMASHLDHQLASKQ